MAQPRAILIAEDDRTSRKILDTMLRRLGYNTICTCNGREAWEALQAQKARLVVTDWMMPEVDGIELCRRIRSPDLGAYVYVIFLTALADKARVVEALDAGADDYLTKPFDPQELRVRVRAGQRVVDLEEDLRTQARELQSTMHFAAAARDRMESVIESVGQGIISVDNEGMLHSINHEARRLLGDGSDKLVGQHLREMPERFDALGELALGEGKYPRTITIRETDLVVEASAFRIRPLGKSPGVIVTLTDISERDRMQREIEDANRRLKDLAVTDVMTDLANHRKFQEAISSLVKLAHRSTRSLSLLMIDVDHFKEYNDEFGHPAGDRVLAFVGKVLKKEIRDTDIAARYGGEEFAVIIVDTGTEGALYIAERIRSRIETSSGEQDRAPVTVSIGVATLPEDGADAGALIAAADKALYAAKEAGRNRVCAASGSGLTSAVRRAS
jgi:two-component system cell cycle response regulator